MAALEVVRNGKAGRFKAKEPRFKLEEIPPDYHLREQWDVVKAGIEDVIAKSAIYKGFEIDEHGRKVPKKIGQIYTYAPEDIYMALRARRAQLYMALMDGQLNGFGILQRREDALGNDPAFLLSYIGWCSDRETRLAYYKEIENVARGLKLKEIRHESTRKGWLRDKPGPEWETLTSEGWIKDLTREQAHRLSLAPWFVQRVLV